MADSSNGQPPGHGTSNNPMATDFPNPVFTLDDMPPEILALILECLVPQPPEIGDTHPVAYDQLVSDEPWFDFTRRRRGLHSVCLVSRRFAEMARPLLYRIVALCDESSMVLFLRTMCEKPRYAQWTRHLSCHLTLTSETVIRETRRALTKYLPSIKLVIESENLNNMARQMLAALKFGIQTNQRTPALPGLVDHYPQLVLLVILIFLTKLEVLLLQVPICDDDPEYDGFCAQVEAVKRLFSTYNEPEITPFQNIHTLLLQGDPDLLEHFEAENCDCEIPEAWGAQPRQYASLYESFPNLTTLEVSADDGIWTNVEEERLSFLVGGRVPTPYLANIRKIYLHNSLACPRNLHQILLNAPKLETLYMTSRPYEPTIETHHDNSTHADPEAFDFGLMRHAKKLRNLDISWVDVRGFECLIGPEGRLAALAQMERLETLCIQLAVLYGKPSTVAEIPLVDLLPPNLVELTLEDWYVSFPSLIPIPRKDLVS
jgi:hypothetical protein